MTAPLRLRVTESDFQGALVEYAQLSGWRVLVIRKARTADGWRTPVGGDGVGWPDLFAVRGNRAVAAELKALGGRLRPEQRDWLAALRVAGIECFTWTPSDWPEVERVLAREPHP